MSGGFFNYSQNYIINIYESIQSELDKQGKRAINASFYSKIELEENPELGVYPTYSEEIQKRFREAIEILKKAEIYVKRIDWYLSGDDGEESFLKRLKEDLDKI